MNWRSIWAILAGVLAVVAITTLVDIVLHVVHVYPPMDQPLNDVQALLATAYRVVFGIAGAWLTARLAPAKPMKHVIVLGALGTVAALVGVVATWNRGMGPRWYPISLVVLAIPQSWLGGWLFVRRSGTPEQPGR